MPINNEPPPGYAWATTLVPSQPPQTRDDLLRYDDESNNNVKGFKYTRLENMRHRIRLLKLRPGRQNSNAEVACELFEAEFQQVQGGRDILKAVDSDETYEYEALTWCWGNMTPDYLIFIESKNNTRSKLAVSAEVAYALKHLRRDDTCRILWIDAICIDQKSTDEKNHQVQMMSKIYSYAERVCVWLGMDDVSSRKAIAFVKDEILQLQRFDELCDDEGNAQKWQALLLLMQRPWFFRRWVVQEISLAKDAVIHCGPDQIPWNDFCVAVELFVEVETATHRLSEVIKKDPKFYHLPGWFDYVSALGASLLVQATTTIFRRYNPESLQKRRAEGFRRRGTILRPIDSSDDGTHPRDSESDTSSNYSDDEDIAPRHKVPMKDDDGSDDPRLSRTPLLNLEYLVSKLSIFETSEPRDAIYAFLAIAKDTVPEAFVRAGEATAEEKKQAALAFFKKKEQKSFPVNYDRPYAEVCQDFMKFCIENSTLPEARARALDILCRPWAPSPSIGISKGKGRNVRLDPIIGNDYAKRDEIFKKRKEAINRECNESLRKKSKTKHLKDPPPDVTGEHEGELRAFMEKYGTRLHRMARKKEDYAFPSWIPRLEGAPFIMSATPGTNIKKMLRQNADPLVGLPGDQRTYDAGQGMGVNMAALRFNRLYLQGAHCMHVKGFRFDRVDRISPTSQGGQIPKQWLNLAGWTDAGDSQKDKGPPEEFWRTLVADRGVNARNPPSFYARACKESAVKGGLAGGTISTSDLIYNERNSIVVQFCRRVQEVIWNKKLIVTEDGFLGLASDKVRQDDLICILYGTSVPVVLRRKKKTQEHMQMERDELALFRKLEILRRLFHTMTAKRRRAKFWKRLPEVPSAADIAKDGRRWGKKQVRQDLREWQEWLRRQNGQDVPTSPTTAVNSSEELRPPARAQTARETSSKGLFTNSTSGTSNMSAIQEASEGDTGATGANVPPQKLEKEPPKVEEYYYKFLGECYIHGMMDGEAMRRKVEQSQNNPNYEDLIFELR